MNPTDTDETCRLAKQWLEGNVKFDTIKQANVFFTAMAKESVRQHDNNKPVANNELESCLGEAVDLMEDVIKGEYTPDSFTTQPWRRALNNIPQEPVANREALVEPIRDLLIANNGLMKSTTAVPYGVANEIINLCQQHILRSKCACVFENGIEVVEERCKYHGENKHMSQDKWVSISEKLPKDNGYYLVCCSGLAVIRLYNLEHGGFISESPVTHWQPLPKPPQGNDK